MKQYVISVWYRDSSCAKDDQDYEWLSMFIVRGESKERALAWGNYLAERYASSIKNSVLRVEASDQRPSRLEKEKLPLIVEGELNLNYEIGIE